MSILEKQVDKDHYSFASYMSKGRWASIWYQLDEIQKLKPENVLEIGPGTGVLKAAAALFGIKIETLDLAQDLKPDFIASVTAMPFEDSSYDVVCAFQMLEHLPYEMSLKAFREMSRVCRRNVVISLPDAQPVLRYHLQLPKLGAYDLLVPRPRLRLPEHKFDGEHYWEVNKRNYSLLQVIADLSESMRMVRTYRVPENPSHRFFVFEMTGSEKSQNNE